MTLLEIETELARETGKNYSTLDANTKARFLAAINRHYRRLASLPGLQHLRDTTTTFPSVAGQAEYQIGSVAKIKRIWDTTNRRELRPMSMAQYRTISPEAIADNQGTPDFWIWESYSGTSTQKFDIYLYRTPDSVITYTADITSVLTLLTADGDIPILPTDFHDLLYYGALADEYRHMDDSRVGPTMQYFMDREKQFKLWMHEPDAGSNSLPSNSSRLGSMFPAGS